MSESMHNYAYHPSVANWLQSTQHATALDGTTDDVPESSPDDYYRQSSSVQPPQEQFPPYVEPAMMTSTRPRQPSNGALSNRPPFRAGGIASTSSHPASRSSPQLPINTTRPTVKSLAQKFNQPASNDSSPSSTTRARPVRPAPPSRSTSDSVAPTPSAARPVKEMSYGPHKFTNLKPRERPQPAPPSPASSRRTATTNGERKPTEDPTSPRSRRPTAGSRKHSHASVTSVTSTGEPRRPFFGEVIGEDATLPGFGIPVLDPIAQDDAEPPCTPPRIEDDAASKAMTIDSHLSPRSFRSVHSPIDSHNDSHFSPKSLHSVSSPPIRHRRAPSDLQGQPLVQKDTPASDSQQKPRRKSPTSRIPVSSRRLSTASDSSSSNRSYKASSARPPGIYKSSVRQQWTPGRGEGLPSIGSKTTPKSTPPATTYRDHSERGKSPKASSAGKSLAAVIAPTSKQQPPSPRLRNSRERQLVSQPSSPSRTPLCSPREEVTPNGHAENSTAELLLQPTRYNSAGIGPDYFPDTSGGADPKHTETAESGSSESAPARHPKRTVRTSQTMLSPKRYEEATGQKRHFVQPTTLSANNGINVMEMLEREISMAAPSAENNGDSNTAQQDPLRVHTSNPAAPPLAAPVSATTDFEESPVLGMPGGFMMTPPVQKSPLLSSSEEAHVTPPVTTNQEAPDTSATQPKEASGGELLQPVTFQPFNKHLHLNPATATLMSDDLPSELGVRESIPIMLGDEDMSPTSGRQSPRQSMLSAKRWRAEPLDASGTISYIDEDESPIDPFPNRATLRPDDSASNVAFFNHAAWKEQRPPMPSNGLTLDSEAYSVINKLLNMYSKSPKISAELAHESRQKIQKVSPVLAQHADWGSKEATETYLARLLSDANGAEQPTAELDGAPGDQRVSKDISRPDIPVPQYRELEESPVEPHAGGTAIIFPPESRRYSRGSHSSAATTIHDDRSRAESSSGFHARDCSPEPAASAPQRLQPTTFVPVPPPKDSKPSPRAGQSSRGSESRAQPGFGPLLPEIKTTGEGLGLGLPASQQQHQHSRPPPQPTAAPPPPPTASASTGKVPYTPSLYSPNPISPAAGSAGQAPQRKAAMCLTPGAPFPYNEAYATANEGSAHEKYRPEQQQSTHGQTDGPIRQSTSSSLATTLNERPDSTETWNRSSTTLTEAADNDVSANDVPNESQTDDAAAVTDSASNVPAVQHRAAFPSENEEKITKRLHRRYRILEELHTTEGGYMSDLMVISQIWLATSIKAEVFSPQERQTVFCNVEELEALSAQMAIDLKKACEPIRVPREPKGEGEEVEPEDPTAPEPEDKWDYCTLDNDDKTSVGYVLKQYLPMIEDLYAKYILNHDKANKIIVSRGKEQDAVFLGWQVACHEHSKDITDAWDLDSLLVKPVQRLMKYPLMLQTLQECTPPTHDDYNDIDIARKGIIEISVKINEKKKRMETVRQATKEGKKGKKKGFPGIDIVRAFGSKDKIKTIASELFVDPEYDEHSQKFGGHFFQIQILINDFTKYREELTTCFVHLNIVALSIVALLEDQQSSSPEIESAWRHNAMALLELRNVLLEDHKTAVGEKVLEPLNKLWAMYVRPQKLLDQRKKGLIQYMRYKQALDRKEKIEPKLEDAAQQFLAVNDALKEELPKLYTLSKKCVQIIFRGFIMYQKNWWKNCQKKMLPLLETEPEHSTSFTADMQDYVNRFKSDWASIQAVVDRLDICNGNLMSNVANLQSPHVASLYGDDSSSRKSTSRRTESMGSDMSIMNAHVPHHRRSAGYNPSQRTIPSFEGPPRSAHSGMQTAYQPAATPNAGPSSAGDYPWELTQTSSRSSSNHGTAPISGRDERAISPASDRSDATLTKTHSNGRNSIQPFPPLDGVFDSPVPHQETSLGSATHLPAPNRSPSYSTSTSSRGSAIFQSALPMGDSPSASRSVEELPGTPADPEEPEVLFLAASLFEFNIAHDRREGGIPYLVYVPGEIFDVIGMKGELWLARNQDDPNRTVGWIWEKHFARILPEES